MGIFGFFKKQFIDVIDWTEGDAGVLAFRYPMEDREIQSGAKLTVRDSQMALFVDEGRIADAFTKPGLYTLNTNTLPVLTNLKNWDKLFASPFKSDVYFMSTREQLDRRWGTPNPITIRDKEYGPIRLRAHGAFSYKVADPKTFYQKVSATSEHFTVEQMDGQLRAAILTSLATFFGGSQINFLDMAGNQTSFSETLKEVLSITFASYGLKLQSFFVQNISLPEELQAHLDKAASMNMVGDLRRYAQFQTAESIPMAAANEGGVAGAGAGIGAGLAIGQQMGQAFGHAAGGGSAAAANPEDAIATLGKLHEMLTKGVLTQAEFDAKKAELLKKIT